MSEYQPMQLNHPPGCNCIDCTLLRERSFSNAVAAQKKRRTPRVDKLEKKNREDRVASIVMRALVTEPDICGERIGNVRFTDKGCSIDLANGDTIAIRITAYAATND